MIPIKFLLILSFSLLLLFQLGVFGTSLIGSLYFKFRKAYLCWALSIALSCLGYIFSLAEIISSVQLSKLSFLVTIATVCFGLSQALLIQVLQALDGKKTFRKSSYFLILLTAVYVLLFEYGRVYEDFIFRGVLTSAFYSIASVLELAILWRLKQAKERKWSKQLYFPVVAIVFNLLISLFRAIYLLNPSMLDLPFSIGFSVIIFATAQVFFTLIFVGISYYWVEEVGISNRTLLLESQEYQTLMMAKERTLNQLLLSQKSTMFGAYAHLVAHEINQPLASLKMNADFLKELLLPKTNLALERSLVDSIDQEIHRAASIIQSIRGLLTQEKTVSFGISIDTLIMEVVDSLRNRLDQNNIEFNLSLNAPTLISANKGELQLVFINLIENAMAALASQSMGSSSKTEFRGQITVETYFENQHVVIKVIDNGPGIRLERQEGLFEFHYTSKSGGAGIGLWLSRYIVERNNGSLIFQSPTGNVGACFIATLPRSLYPA
jgi:signal transduction histidine kinase